MAPVSEMKAAVNDAELHPLESSWDLWYLSADKTKDWDDRLTKLMTFQTVEEKVKKVFIPFSWRNYRYDYMCDFL